MTTSQARRSLTHNEFLILKNVEKTSFDWIAQKFWNRFHRNAVITGFSEHFSNDFLREWLFFLEKTDFDPLISKTPCIAFVTKHVQDVVEFVLCVCRGVAKLAVRPVY